MGGTERAERDTAEPQAAPVGPELPTTLTIGSAHDAAETKADEVADRVLARLRATDDESLGHGDMPALQPSSGPMAAPGAGVEGGAATADIEAGVAAARGKGSSLDSGAAKRLSAAGVGTSGVGVHTGSKADALCKAVGARAFTVGTDIFFASGQYRPDTEAGMHLIAHEVAHTQESGEALRCSVRRRLAGTAEAAEQLGGGESSGRGRRAFGVLKNWDALLRGLREYEKREAKLDNAHVADFLAARGGMTKSLDGVRSSLREWKQANDEGAAAVVVGRAKRVDTDARTKANRRQAIALLEPRVNTEHKLLEDKDPTAWMSSFGLNNGTAGPNLRAGKGGVNSVQERAYGVGHGETFTGFFKEDKGFAADPENHEIISGIRQTDPRYGARTVAMYKLDQLLGAGVTARAEFAVGKVDDNSVLGTVMESVNAPQGKQTKIGINDDHAKALGPGAVSLQDPVLQRGLNKLQILDAIAGQLDRHADNYMIETDGNGKVVRVVGIDLDMSFGQDRYAHDTPTLAQHYKGMPSVIDEQLGRAILRLSPADIRAALDGLLPPAEVQATVLRFVSVQDAVRAAEKSGQLAGDWDKVAAQIADERPDANNSRFDAEKKTYSDVLAAQGLDAIKGETRGLVAEAMRGTPLKGMRSGLAAELQELTDEVRKGIVFATDQANALVDLVSDLVYDKSLPSKYVDNIVGLVLDAALSDKVLAELTVLAQEGDERAVLNAAVKGINHLKSDDVRLAAARISALRDRLKN